MVEHLFNEYEPMTRRSQLTEHYRRRREDVRATRSLDLAWRLVIFVVGGTLLGLGLFFLIFPGPGWATILLGLIILGSEFQWALRLLEPIQRTMKRARAAATDNNSRQKRMTVQLVTTVVIVCGIYAYLAKFGFSAEPFFNIRSWIQGLI